MNVPLSRPDITELEVEYVTRVLRSGQLSLGPRVVEFEEKFAAYVGARYAVAVNSGTSALHLAVRALGIGGGDEVITTSFSFVASSNCVMFERALPVFVDIDPNTFNLDPNEIRRFIRNSCVVNPRTGAVSDKQTGRRVRAILPVHVFGVPCDMDSILEIAREYNLHVIEDACEALGAEYKGKRVGTLGELGVFAFCVFPGARRLSLSYRHENTRSFAESDVAVIACCLWFGQRDPQRGYRYRQIFKCQPDGSIRLSTLRRGPQPGKRAVQGSWSLHR